MGALKNNVKKMLGSNNTVTGMKNVFDMFINILPWPWGIKSVSLKIDQKKLPKVKCKLKNKTKQQI